MKNMPMKGRLAYSIPSFFVTILLGLALSRGNAAEPASESETERLARETQNPIANLISVPFQNNFNFGIGPNDATQWILNVQPVRLVQVHVQMPPIRTVSQKDQSSVTHQFDAFVSARRINIKFCCYRYRAILRRRQPAWAKALGKDRARRRLETQAFGKVDRDLQCGALRSGFQTTYSLPFSLQNPGYLGCHRGTKDDEEDWDRTLNRYID